ncbi:Hypothetical protein KP2612_003943 [Komagataella phaffii]|uniref:Uncharacterized protein n=2 Tax=Komagataella phaffii TaxID=460519 RepID=C4R474_KOMPG|nr:Hypothetical protein PAS_chr3_0321 [Komagataella phaffii GS115]AOA63978.1 GQ67_03381T0 [Komagataella phaffii]AOA68252.1 GQ68_03350T0 [Komagataella phaffii GS115]CAY70360.1 Hypothetical protein PAS_chr3_0321 [Komagataella phaffii GS115]
MAVVERIFNNMMPQKTKGPKRSGKGKKVGDNADNGNRNQALGHIDEVNSIADIKDKPSLLGCDHYDDYFPKVSPYEIIGLEISTTSKPVPIEVSSIKRLNVCLKSTFKQTLGLEEFSNARNDPIERLVTFKRDQENFIMADQGFNRSQNFTFDKPTASKRSIVDNLEFKFTTNSNSSNGAKTPMSIFKIQNKLFSDVPTKSKRRRNEKLDNSRTISVRTVLRMVDYSLVSDGEFTSMSMSECNTPTKHCNVLINDDDLAQAKRLVF